MMLHLFAQLHIVCVTVNSEFLLSYLSGSTDDVTLGPSGFSRWNVNVNECPGIYYLELVIWGLVWPLRIFFYDRTMILATLSSKLCCAGKVQRSDIWLKKQFMTIHAWPWITYDQFVSVKMPGVRVLQTLSAEACVYQNMLPHHTGNHEVSCLIVRWACLRGGSCSTIIGIRGS